MKSKNVIIGAITVVLVAVSMLGLAPDSGAVAILLNLVFIVAGFVMLIKGADIFVENASKIAMKFNIPQMVIGLTIVAFGTSLPEAAVSIKAALSGNAGITIGNVVGSNIMNVFLILGVSACIAALAIKKNTLRIEIPFVIVVSFLLLLLGMFGDELSRVDGAIFVLLLAIFMVYLVYSAKSGQADEDEATVISKKDTMIKLLIFVILGGVSIVLGSNVTVEAASFVAAEFGMTPRLIGLTIVAFGTSLPELVTSATAAKRGKTDIAIGNIVGSNIFNILFVVGVSAIITPITFETAFIKDTIVAIAAVVILFICVLPKTKLTRAAGALMIACYAAYFSYILYINYAA